MARGKFADNKNDKKDNPRNRKLFGGPSSGVRFGMHRAVMQNEPEPALPEPMQAQIEEVPQMQLAVLEEVQEAAEVHERKLRMQAEDHRLEEWLQTMEASKTRRHRSISGFFKKKNSEQYTAVMNSIKSVLVHTKVPFKDDSRTNLDRVKNVSNAYFKLIDACEVYLNKEGGQSASGQARKNMVQEVLNLAKEDITAVQQCYADIYSRKISEEDQAKLNWEEIIHSAREATIEVDDLYNDEMFTPLGDGVKVGEKAGRKLQAGVFVKEEKAEITGKNRNDGIGAAFNVQPKDMLAGDYGKENNVTNRNVATSRMAALLGLSGIVEESKTVNVKDNRTGNTYKGNLMSFAKGKDAEKVSRKKAEKYGKKMDNIEDKIKSAQSVFAPSLQKELCSLQVLDYICGQNDRKRGNYFIEKDDIGRYAHVHGIDNDMSFGTGVDFAKELDDLRDVGWAVKMRPVVGRNGELTIPYMDKKLAQNIISLDPDIVRFVLKDLLAPQFIENTVLRLKMVQDAIKKEDKGFNSPRFKEDGEWGADTADDMLKRTGAWKIVMNGADKNAGMDTHGESTYFAELVMNTMGFNFNTRKFM